MSRRIADLLIKVGADSYEFEQVIQKTQKTIGGLSSQLNSIGKSLSLKLTAPLMALGVLSVQNADAQAKAEAKVQQALKSTREASKLTLAELANYAAELQGRTLFDDDNIMNSVTAQLLTFTNIAGQNFKRTQAVALDLATVLDGDLKSASIQLGKALNDPVKNLSALSRAGIQFSKEQHAVIKKLVETNQLAKAQSVILGELERQYGGQAEAAAKVGLGGLTQLKNAIGDLMEEFGKILLPMIDRIAKALMKTVGWLQGLSPEVKNAIVVVSGLVAAIGPLALGLGTVLKILPLITAGFAAMTGPVGLVLIGITAVSAGLFALFSNSNKAAEASRRLANTNKEYVRDLTREQAEIDRAFGKLDGLTKGTKEYDQTKRDIISKYGEYLTGLSKEVQTLEDVKTAYEEISAAAKQAARDRAIEKASSSSVDAYAKAEADNLIHIRDEYLSKFGNFEGEARFTRLRNQLVNGLDVSSEIDQVVRQFDKLEDIGRGSAPILNNPVLAYINNIKEAKRVLKTEQKEIKAIWGELGSSTQKEVKQTEEDLNGLGGAAEKTGGIINNLKKQIEALEKKKLIPNATIEQIAKLNAEIEKLQRELNAILNTKPKPGWLGDAAAGEMQTLGGEFKPAKFSSDVEGQDKRNYQLIDPSAVVQSIDSTLEAARKKLIEKTAAITQEINSMLQSLLQDLAIGLGESIGDMISGDLGLDGVIAGIGAQIGRFLQQIGQMLITYAIQFQAFKTSLQSIAKAFPLLAIPVGIALIAAGKALSNKMMKTAQAQAPALANGGLAYGPTYAMIGDNPNAHIDPEVVAPLSKLRNILGGGSSSNINITLSGELRAKGSDLALALKKNNARYTLVNG